MGYKNILVPLDGSELAEKVLHHLVPIAEPGANIHILSVITEDNSVMTAVALTSAYSRIIPDNVALNSHEPHIYNERQDYLAKVTSSLSESGYNVILDVRYGDVVNSIIEAARGGYDAIVMATHGRTGFSKALLGSVAQSIVVKSPCPIVLIPANATDPA